MKVTIEFTLPEEREEMELAIKGHGYASVLSDTDNQLRTLIKHNQDLSDDVLVGLQMARDILREQASTNSVDVC